MKKLALFIFSTVLVNFTGLSAFCGSCRDSHFEDVTDEIPLIESKRSLAKHFEKVPDVAEYGGANWNNVIGISKGISLEEAYEIALESPEITYFFHMEGISMSLRTPEGKWRIFNRGDAVFFTGEPWWGSAKGLANGYIKVSSAS
ncbi:MAG: hypothetical protein K2P51_04980 [Rhabdochlamydiaceae bacterium]|nr:hypothetical protein [Rhabdochlamydiaceae bacterium]